MLTFILLAVLIDSNGTAHEFEMQAGLTQQECFKAITELEVQQPQVIWLCEPDGGYKL